MSLTKKKMTQYGMEADFWVVTGAQLGLHPFGTKEKDENGNVVGISGGANTILTLGLFLNMQAYIEGKPSVEQKTVVIPYGMAVPPLTIANNPKSVLEILYESIVQVDGYFEDAQFIDMSKFNPEPPEETEE